MFKRILLPLFFLALASPALAQEDIQLPAPIAGLYPLKVEIVSNEPLSKLCVDRVDLGAPFELLCVADPPSAAGSVIKLDILVMTTPGDDAELRAYVVDKQDNRSGYSPNAAFADFTAPAAPILLATP